MARAFGRARDRSVGGDGRVGTSRSPIPRAWTISVVAGNSDAILFMRHDLTNDTRSSSFFLALFPGSRFDPSLTIPPLSVIA